jgi:hypothetical protein
LARYFSAESGSEQLEWILQGLPESLNPSANLSCITPEEYNSSTNIFSNSSSLELFSQCTKNIGIFYPFPQSANGLVANVLLYCPSKFSGTRLNDGATIQSLFEEALRLLDKRFQVEDSQIFLNPAKNIGPLIHTLSKMQHIFSEGRK